jgi:type IV secretion system protein VirD4
MRIAANPSSPRDVVVAALMLPLFGVFAWTAVWTLLHGGSVGPALLDPIAAPRAWLGLPGETRDPLLSLSGGIALLLAGGLAAALFAPRTQPVFGDARFARIRELRGMGLLAGTGLLLGRVTGLSPGYLRHDGPLHLLLTAPTRSGKGVGVVTPNLLSWAGSAVVLDIKDENFLATSGFRTAHNQRVVRFAPADPDGRTARYNPLDTVRRDTRHRIADLQAIGHLLAHDTSGEAAMWAQEARSLFVGLCLYILDTPGLPLTFGQVSRILQTNEPFGDAISGMLAERSSSLDPACVNMLGSFAGKAAKEQSGVRSTLTGALELWNDPLIDAATSVSDFDLATLRRMATTIYVSISLDQLVRCAFLLNIVFQQLVGVMTRTLPGSDEPLSVLVLVDEFASLGRMDLLVDKMPFLAGFNVRLALIVQGLAQLDRLYGAAGRELILQNAGLQLFFASNDDQTSSYVSQRLGTYTDAQATRSRSMPLFGGGHGSITKGQSLHARPLISIDQIRRLDRATEILFVEGARPVRARKIVYYRDRAFLSRRLPPVAVEAVPVVRHPPFRFPTTKTVAGNGTSKRSDVRTLSDDELDELRALGARGTSDA